jgi:hypothetical protein
LDDSQRLARPAGSDDARCAGARRVAPGVRYFPLKSLGHWRGVPRDCAVLIFEWELSYSVACGREVTRSRSCSRLRGGTVGRALHGTGAEGGPRSASTVWDRRGVTRRPTFSCECDYVFHQLMVANGIVNFNRYISPEIAPAGLPEIQAARDLRIRPAAIFRSSTKRWYSRALASASGTRNR